MPEKKGCMGAVVKGCFVGIGIGILIGGLLSVIFNVDISGIIVLCLFISIIYSVIKTNRENTEAEEEYWENIRINNEKRKRDEKQRADEEARVNREAARNEWRRGELEKLKLMFDEGKSVADLIEHSQFKNELMNELENRVTEYEKLYFEILKNPEIALEMRIWGDICFPREALNRITESLHLNTVFWKDKHDEWEKHSKYCAKLNSYQVVSTILVQGQYGIANEEQIRLINKYDLSEYAKSFDEWYKKENTEEKLNFDYVFEAMWKFAFEKPCDLERFNLASNVIKNYLYRLAEVENGKQQIISLDVILAELYVAKGFGEKILKEKKILMDIWLDYYINLFVYIAQKSITNQYGIVPCIELASGLKWIGLYEFEAEVLRRIVTAGLPLSDDLQERLRFIENVGNDLKKVYDIEENAAYLSVDYAALNWKEDDFVKLFQTLVFENIHLRYALTIREWSKNILMERKTGLDIDEAFAVVKSIIREEYISSVRCEKTEVQFLAEDGSESRKTALLMVPDKSQVGFGYVGLLLNVIGFGRNINLRIYTIFIPEDVPLETQKQQALTLKKSTNPDVVAFESGLQTSILKGMEEYMNVGYATVSNDKQIPERSSDYSTVKEQRTEQLF